MGVSGAGKTTLLDVLSGRKTSGYTRGEIKIGGYRKSQETYARVSCYCEQNDIHSPLITVEESVAFSAWLRLPPQIDSKTKSVWLKTTYVHIYTQLNQVPFKPSPMQMLCLAQKKYFNMLFLLCAQTNNTL